MTICFSKSYFGTGPRQSIQRLKKGKKMAPHFVFVDAHALGPRKVWQITSSWLAGPLFVLADCKSSTLLLLLPERI